MFPVILMSIKKSYSEALTKGIFNGLGTMSSDAVQQCQSRRLSCGAPSRGAVGRLRVLGKVSPCTAAGWAVGVAVRVPCPGWLRQEIFIPTVLEAERPKSEMPGDSVSARPRLTEACLPAVSPQGAEREPGLWSLLVRALIAPRGPPPA